MTLGGSLTLTSAVEATFHDAHRKSQMLLMHTRLGTPASKAAAPKYQAKSADLANHRFRVVAILASCIPCGRSHLIQPNPE